MSGRPSASRHLVLSVPGGALRVERRAAVVGVLTTLALAVVAVVAMMLGDYRLTAREVIDALAGVGDRLAVFFVQEQRAPRVVAAVLVGAALGVSGAILQSISGNPLGSPDIVGFTVGSATGALVAILVFDAGPMAVAGGAVIGGLATAVLVFALARDAGLSAERIVLVGVGVAVVLQSVNSLLIVRASLGRAQTAVQWLAGSFNAVTWERTGAIGLSLVVLLPVALVLGRSLTMLELGDTMAAGLGVPVERHRAMLVVVSVALVAVATGTAGPIAFVALAAPQIARRLSRAARPSLLAASLTGALLVLVSDLLAQRLFAPTQLAVGVVSGSLGGLYLIWLLGREWRKA